MSVHCPICDSLVSREIGARRLAAQPCLACQRTASDSDADFLRQTAVWVVKQNGPAAARLRDIANKLQILERQAQEQSWRDNPDRMGG